MATVVIVEDEDSLRETLSRYLIHEGHEVISAASGHEALDSVVIRNASASVIGGAGDHSRTSPVIVNPSKRVTSVHAPPIRTSRTPPRRQACGSSTSTPTAPARRPT